MKGEDERRNLEGPVLGILITGQSLAEGGMGRDRVASVDVPYDPGRALMLSGGPVGVQRSVLQLPLTPLRDAKRRVTLASSLARALLESAEDKHFKLVVSGQAWGGKTYGDLKKQSISGFRVYEQCLEQVAKVVSVLPKVVYRALLVVHGEQDGLQGNPAYEANLAEWVRDFDRDIRRITGQQEPVRMYLCQTSTAGGYGFNRSIADTAFTTPLAQLAAHEHHPDITLVCPKYFLPYADYAHITNLGQRILGEYYAKALAAHLRGRVWEPFRPRAFSVVERAVMIDFQVPAGELEFDTQRVCPAPHFGFDYCDDAGTRILSVEKTGPAQVTLYLSGAVAANAVLSYAFGNGSGGAAQTEGLGDRGNLRDQDAGTSAYDGTYRLFNWCCSFRQRVR